MVPPGVPPGFGTDAPLLNGAGGASSDSASASAAASPGDGGFADMNFLDPSFLATDLALPGGSAAFGARKKGGGSRLMGLFGSDNNAGGDEFPDMANW